MNFKDIAVRYGISTAGLVLIAMGVGLSIKSNLGVAPPSCPPTVLNLQFTHISVGTFTWLMHLLFIGLQALILRKNFKLRYLMQIPAAFVFGYLCDLFIWMFDAIASPSSDYAMQMFLCLISVPITAVGIKLEVLGEGWILAGDKMVAVLADAFRLPYGTVKVLFDLAMVLFTVVFAYICFGLLTGNGSTVVIREGTLILAFLTGICMRFTDPVMEKLFQRRKADE